MKPPEALRAFPRRGTPPLARQSRLHSGTAFLPRQFLRCTESAVRCEYR